MFQRFATHAMGTRFELVLEGEGEARARALAEAVWEELRECEARWSVFAAGSLLSKVNREAPSRPVAVDPETLALLEEALECWSATGGWFDPALGGEMARWGFRDGTAGEMAVELAAAATPRAGAPFVLDRAACSVAALRGALDLGAVAKGFALDLAGELLRDEGVGCALLHGGTSSVLALGAPGGAEGWSVALAEGSEAPRALLRDAALAVSCNSGRRKGADGHLLDPHSGRPTTHDALAAVVAGRASRADAWATALCARGEEAAASFIPGDLQVLLRPSLGGDAWRDLSTDHSPFHFPLPATTGIR